MAIARERGELLFRKTEKELLRLASGELPEAVHGFRTTTRRLQTVLEHLFPDGDRNQKKLLKLLNRIRKRAGKIRDIDVQLAALRSLKIVQEPRRKTQLTQRLLELRSQHERKLSKLLTRSNVGDIRRRIKRASRDFGSAGKHDPVVVARQMLLPVAPANGGISEEWLHRYRLAVKSARYVAEFAPKSSEGTQLIAELKSLQDVLGSWHDWLILTQTAVERLGDVNQSSLVAALHNVTRSKFRHAVAAISANQPGSRKPATGKPELRGAGPSRDQDAASVRGPEIAA